MGDVADLTHVPHLLEILAAFGVGLMFHVLGTYLVRAIDHVKNVLPAFYRRARDKEFARIERLTTAATSDNALYAALAAEASRLRSHQLLCFFVAFVCMNFLLFVQVAGELHPGLGLSGLFVLVFLVGCGLIQFVRGLDIGTRLRRLDIALRAVQRIRELPFMD